MNFSVDFFITTISLLQKFYLTSTEMKDDKKISGKKKVEYRRLTSGNKLATFFLVLQKPSNPAGFFVAHLR